MNLFPCSSALSPRGCVHGGCEGGGGGVGGGGGGGVGGGGGGGAK